MEGRKGDHFPYSGARWYAAEVAEYMLDVHIVMPSECKKGLRASKRLESKTLEKAIDTIKATWPEALAHHPSPPGNVDGIAKQAVLSAIGLWNCTEQHQWNRCRSTYESDAGEGLKLKRPMPDGSYIFTTSTELVSLKTNSPWGRIALDVEQMRISQALRAIEKHDELTVVGAHVDGVFFLSYSFDFASLREELENTAKFADGTAAFHVKREPVSKVPTWKQRVESRSQTLDFRPHQWTIMQEPDSVDALADLFLERGGLYLSGPAGVGKTYMIHQMLPNIAKKVPSNTNFIIMSLTHNAAMLVGGKTIARCLHKYRTKGGSPKAGTIVVVDELSRVQLHTWAELLQWKLMGVRFIVAGDLDGQFKPIFDHWQKAMDAKDIRDSQFLHELAEGLRVKMTVYRRGTDRELFDRYCGLYDCADNTDSNFINSKVVEARSWYPFNGEEIDTYFVLSHKHRVILNACTNRRLAARQDEKLFLKSPGEMHGATMQPQDVYIWKGMELVCCTRKHKTKSVSNGAVYYVVSWTDAVVKVRLHPDYICTFSVDSLKSKPLEENEIDEEVDDLEDDDDMEEEDAEIAPEPEDKYAFSLSHEAAARLLRVQHALVYASIQGRTMRQTHIGLMDVHHENFTIRHLIVALSRATHGEYVHIFNTSQQTAALSQVACSSGER